MTNLFEAFIDRYIGPLLDQIGTRDEVVETNGNVTEYRVIDKQSGKTIGRGVILVRDGIYVSKQLNEASTLRQQVMEKLAAKRGDSKKTL